MKKWLLLPLLLLMLQATGRQFEYFTTETLDFYSEAVGENFKIDLQLPENYFLSADSTTFPLIILLDQQNTFTYNYNLHSIDMLMFHSQMPQAVVPGIPFTMQNRLSLTAVEDFYGTKGRIENTTQFIFDELIPHLKKHFRAGKPVLIFGHSRTGFLTAYFMINRSEDFEVAGSFSSFFEKGFELPDVEKFLQTKEDSSKAFSFYFSAGTKTNEEAGYLKHLLQLETFLNTRELPANFSWQFYQQPFANHITNYNLSLPLALTHYFGNYNLLLDKWLFEKLNETKPENTAMELMEDFDALSSHYQAPINPDFVHIYSIASALINDHPAQALDIFKIGKSFYPYDYELDYSIISLMLSTGQTEKAEEWLQSATAAIEAGNRLTDVEKQQTISALQSLFE
jgi:enterochelin esterase-like enzyme